MFIQRKKNWQEERKEKEKEKKINNSILLAYEKDCCSRVSVLYSLPSPQTGLVHSTLFLHILLGFLVSGLVEVERVSFRLTLSGHRNIYVKQLNSHSWCCITIIIQVNNIANDEILIKLCDIFAAKQ